MVDLTNFWLQDHNCIYFCPVTSSIWWPTQSLLCSIFYQTCVQVSAGNLAARVVISTDRLQARFYLWSLLQYDFVKAQAHCHANPTVVFTYGSALETNSPRLNGPGDFFTYLFFVATVILVSHRAHPIQMRNCIGFGQYFSSLACRTRHRLFSSFFFLKPRIICPPSRKLAEAVPGTEEDHPCISYTHSFANFSGCMRCRNGGNTFEIASVIK